MLTRSGGRQGLRVLHVTAYSANAWAFGGIPRLSDTMTRGLAARGHTVTICTTDACDERHRLQPSPGASARRPWPPFSTPDSVVVRVFPNISNRLAHDFQCFLPIGLGGFLRQHAASFDVAHLHACRNFPGAIAAHHLRAAGVPYVLAPNGTAPNIERLRVPKQLFDLVLGRRMMNQAARVLAVTEVERLQLTELGVAPERIRVIPNPLDLDEFTPPPQRGAYRARVQGTGPLVVFLGKLTPRKRVDLLVRAFAQLVRSDATLVIAGNDMGTGEAVRALADRLGIGPRTCFTGLLPGRERLALLADADVVVYPSEYEIFGLVPLEALLAGTPVIVTDDSGCGEVIGRTGGGLVVPGHVEALTAALERILDAPDHWRAAAREAAVRVRHMCAPDVVCEQIEQIYAEMAA